MHPSLSRDGHSSPPPQSLGSSARSTSLYRLCSQHLSWPSMRISPASIKILKCKAERTPGSASVGATPVAFLMPHSHMVCPYTLEAVVYQRNRPTSLQSRFSLGHSGLETVRNFPNIGFQGHVGSYQGLERSSVPRRTCRLSMNTESVGRWSCDRLPYLVY